MAQVPPNIDPYSPPPLPPEALLGQSPNTPTRPDPLAGYGGYGTSFHSSTPPGSLPPEPFDRAPVRRTPIWLWVVTLGLLAVLIVMQRPEDEKPSRLRDEAAGIGAIKAPEVSPFVLIGKLIFAMRDLTAAAGAGGTPPPSLTGQDPVVAFVEMSDSTAGWVGKDRLSPASVTNPPRRNKHPEPAADRLRATIVAAEFLDKDEIEWRIRDVEKSLDATSKLVSDVRIVRAVYGLGDAPPPEPKAAEPTDPDAPELDADADTSTPTKHPPIVIHTPTKEELAASRDAIAAIPDSDKQDFRARHGWFANLVLTRGDDPSPLRQDAASQGFMMIVLMCILMGVIGLAFLTGLVFLIIGFVKLISGTLRPHFVRPVPATEWPINHSAGQDFPRAVAFATPGSVWLETVAVFFAMFLGIKFVVLALEHFGASKDTLILGTLGAQWLILLSIFWPIVRGMPFRRWREEIGWRTNGSLLKEIGAGIAGYLAGLPIYFGMALVVVALTFLIGYFTGTEPHPGAGNRLTDVLEGGGTLELVLIFTLATMWAPIVEESIFRGCLFRHLRRRTGVVLAALGSAAVFAVLHGYIIQGLFMVGALGFWFALIREWRGSIIATATAHALHNGVVMTILIIAMSFARA